MDKAAMIAAVERQHEDVLRQVASYGMVVLAMGQGPSLPPVAFTVGGAVTKLPDLIMYGMSPEWSVQTLNNAFQVLREEWPFPNQTRSSKVLEGSDVAFRDVSRSDLLQHAMFHTHMFNVRQGHAQTPLLQVCWPDKNGIFPNEQGCDPGVAECQRVRGLRS